MNTKQHIVAFLLAFAVLSVGVSSSSAAAACPDRNRPAASNADTRWRASLLCMTNHQRTVHHLHTLKLSKQLASGAQKYAAQMVSQHFFAHQSPAGVQLESRIRATGYLRGMNLWGVGENIYATGMPTQTPAQAMAAWMSSPHHQENILDPSWREFGAGIVHSMPSTPQGWTMTQWFAIRQR